MKKRKTAGQRKQQAKFRKSAKKCSKKKGNFRACMRKELRKR